MNEPHFDEPGDDAGRLPDNVIDSATVQSSDFLARHAFNRGRLPNASLLASVKYTWELFLFRFFPFV